MKLREIQTKIGKYIVITQDGSEYSFANREKRYISIGYFCLFSFMMYYKSPNLGSTRGVTFRLP